MVYSEYQPFNLGTQKFFESVKVVSINYKEEISKSDVDQDLDTLYQYFKNLSCINLSEIKHPRFTEIIGIVNNSNINLISF